MYNSVTICTVIQETYTFVKFVVLLQHNQPASNFIKTVYDSFIYLTFYAIHSDKIEIITCILYQIIYFTL